MRYVLAPITKSVFRVPYVDLAKMEELLRVSDLDWTVLPEGVSRSRFEAPSGALAVIEAGRPGNPRVVLVPGVTGSKEDFVLMLPLLADAGFHVDQRDISFFRGQRPGQRRIGISVHDDRFRPLRRQDPV